VEAELGRRQDRAGDLAAERPAPGAQQRLLVEGVVDRLADLELAGRAGRRVDVERDVLDAAVDVGGELLGQLGVGRQDAQARDRRLQVQRQVAVAALDALLRRLLVEPSVTSIRSTQALRSGSLAALQLGLRWKEMLLPGTYLSRV
jgi:hypothetical protein